MSRAKVATGLTGDLFQLMLSLDLGTALVLRLLGSTLGSVLEIANQYGPCQLMLSLCLVPVWLSITSSFLSMFFFRQIPVLLCFNFFIESLVCGPAKLEQSHLSSNTLSHTLQLHPEAASAPPRRRLRFPSQHARRLASVDLRAVEIPQLPKFIAIPDLQFYTLT